MKPKFVLRQRIRRDYKGNIVYRGKVHAVRIDNKPYGRAACGRYGPGVGRWEVAHSYEVTCEKCKNRLSGKAYHTGRRNQYDKPSNH